MDSEANKLRAKEYGYMEMWLHALLSVLVLLIWDPIWVYRVTKATNKLDHSQNRTPTGAMLLSIFVPFYWVFWQYTVANMLDEHAAKHGENADNGAIVLIFAFLLPFVNVFVIQHRLNREALWETRGRSSVNGPEGFQTDFIGQGYDIPSLMLVAQNGVVVPVEKSVTLIGRSSECDIRFREDASDVSRRHCRIEVQGGHVRLTDLGSTCGTYLRGEKLTPNTPVRLHKGDTFALGKRNHTFTLG